MPIPNYEGFGKDMRGIYTTFKDVKFSDGTVQEGWDTVLAAMTTLTQYPTDENWNSYLQVLDSFHKNEMDAWNSPEIPPEERQKQIDAYNKTYNDSAHEDDVKGQEEWYLHRLTDRLRYATESMMTQQSEFARDKSHLADYMKAYGDFEKDILENADVFERYESYDALKKEISKTFKEKEALEKFLGINAEGKKLKELAKELEGEQRKKSDADDNEKIEKLTAAIDILELNIGTDKEAIQDIYAKIKEQEAIVTAAEKQVEEIENNNKEIEKNARKNKAELEKEQAEYPEQVKRAGLVRAEREKIAKQIETLTTENETLGNFLKDIDKQNDDTYGVLHFFKRVSPTVREQDAKTRRNYEIKETFNALEAANLLVDQAKTFQDEFRNAENFRKMMDTGINFTKYKPEFREQLLKIAPEETKHQLDRYKEKQMMEQAMRKMNEDLGVYSKEEFDKHMQSPEGMCSAAQKFSELQDKKMSALFSGYEDDVNSLAGKIKKKIANEKIIHVLKQQLQEKEDAYKLANNRLESKAGKIADLENQIKKGSKLEQTTIPVKKIKGAKETLENLQISLDKVKKQYDIDTNQQLIDTQEKQNCEKRIDDRKRLAKCYDHLNALHKDKEKMESFTGKLKGVAEKGEQLRGSLKIDKDGNFGKSCTNSAISNLFESLKRHHDTAMLGKKPGHKDTDAYHGMMDNFDKLMNDGLADLQGKKPGEIKKILSQLQDGAAKYIDAKKEQRLHWKPSPMRKARLNFAAELIKLCKEGANQLDKVDSHVKEVQNEYEKSCKPVLNGKSSNELTVDIAKHVIKDIRKNPKQLKVNQKKELNKGTLQKSIPVKQVGM